MWALFVFCFTFVIFPQKRIIIKEETNTLFTPGLIYWWRAEHQHRALRCVLTECYTSQEKIHPKARWSMLRKTANPPTATPQTPQTSVSMLNFNDSWIRKGLNNYFFQWLPGENHCSLSLCICTAADLQENGWKTIECLNGPAMKSRFDLI